jgi:ribosomal protein S10
VTATNVDTTFTQITAKGFKSSIEGPLTLERQRVDVTLARSSDRKRRSAWHFAVDPDRQASLLRVVVEP